ncbi:pyrroloquinoline quinone precursor peptide PqqA [Streptomyces sp. NPDC058308]
MHSNEQEKPAPKPAPRADTTGWQTPEYAIVDTALEVTAHLLADR